MSKTAALGAVSAFALAGCVTQPEMLTQSDREEFSDFLTDAAFADQEPITGPLSLPEAMARALKYNLDHRVSMMEASLAARDADFSRYDLLPQLVVNSAYYARDKEPGASSRSLITRRQSLEPSQSTEQYGFASDLTLSWSILDFGLSYIRAKQLGDEALIAEERRRKAINETMQDVRAAYWRAASAQRLSDQLNALQQQVEDAFLDSRELFEARRTAPLSALTYQRELTEIQAEAQALELELVSAKRELARLMNLPMGMDFEVIVPSRQEATPEFSMRLGDAMEVALENRPEIREAAYRVRMGDRAMKEAVLEALPGIDLYAGYNYDTNDFLFNDDWVAYGAKASWNLLKVFNAPDRYDRAAARAGIERERALATAVAVTSQVHISLMRYEKLRDTLDTAKQANDVQAEILDQIEAGATSGQVSEQTLVRERMNKIVTEARYDLAYAEVQEAFAALYAAVGYDPFGNDITGREGVGTVAESLSLLWNEREAPAAP
ncbi:MAG: TolC family protein [Pseudomonadota bacterium]